MIISITRTDAAYEDIPLPHYATSGSAGMDIHAALREPYTIAPGTVQMIPTAFAIALPEGYEAQIRSRSGLAAKHGIFCLNSPGTIDSDYRGEINVIIANFGTESFIVQRGDRIAQMVVCRYEHVQWQKESSLDETERAGRGFGSTGTR